MGEPDVDAMLRRMSLPMLMEWMLFCPSATPTDVAGPQKLHRTVKRQTPQEMKAVLDKFEAMKKRRKR